MLTVTCPVCTHVMQVPLQYVGQSGPCQKCGQNVQVPHPQDTALEPLSLNLEIPPVSSPHVKRKVVIPRIDNWFTSLGWLAFISSSPLAGLKIWYGLLPLLAVFTLMGIYDLSLQRLSKQELGKLGLGLYFLWPFAYPAYLLKRHDFEGRSLIMLTALFGSMWVMGIVFVDSWAEWYTFVNSGATN